MKSYDDIASLYEDALFDELKKLLDEYKDKIKDGAAHAHVSHEAKAGMIGSGAAVGGAVGTIVPIIGNAIGSIAGAALAAGVAEIIELKNVYDNKKKTNAKKIDDSGINEIDLKNASKLVIESRAVMLEKINLCNKQSIAKYLAVNMMSALKHPGKGSCVEKIVEGVKFTYSKKLSSLSLKDSKDPAIRTLKDIAKGPR